MEPIEAIVKLQAKEKGKLLCILGTSFGIAATLGATIGAGLLRTPSLVAAKLGNIPLIIAIWIVGGIYALLGAISVSELAASLPHNGGWYVYARRALGDFAGFIIGWMDWLANSAILAMILIIFGDYAEGLVPALSGKGKMAAVAVLLLCSLLHLMGLQVSSNCQKILSFAKAVAFIMLVAACFIFGGKNSDVATSQTILAGSQTAASTFIAIVFALQATVATYAGWYAPIYFAEEFSEPERDIPRSILIGVLSVIGICLLVNFALLYVLPLGTIAASDLPMADATEAIFHKHSGQVIKALSLLALLGSINILIMEVPRILYGLSRDGLFSSKGVLVNLRGTPVVALILSTCVEVMLVISGSFARILGIATFLFIVIYTLGFACLFILRKRVPELPRPFKAWGYPWTTCIVLIGSLGFLIGVIYSDTTNSIYALILIMLSYPVYLLKKRLGK